MVGGPLDSWAMYRGPYFDGSNVVESNFVEDMKKLVGRDFNVEKTIVAIMKETIDISWIYVKKRWPKIFFNYMVNESWL